MPVFSAMARRSGKVAKWIPVAACEVMWVTLFVLSQWLSFSEALQMCVAELGRILKAKPKEAIHANMGGPNQPVGQQPELLAQDRKCDEHQRRHEHVENVIENRPEPYAQQIG